MQIENAHNKSIGTEVTGIDLRRLSAEEIERIKQLVYKRRVVTIKDQVLSPVEFIAFGNQIGQVQPYLQENYHHPDHPEIFVSSNVKRDGVPMGVDRTGGYWHTDTAFLPKPNIFTILSPQVLPPIRRTTLFLDMADAYRRVSPAWRHVVDDSMAVHTGRRRYKVRAEDVGTDITEILARVDEFAPPVRHPAVITHPATGERALYLSSGFTARLESDALDLGQPRDLDDLFAEIEAEAHVQDAVWHVGDIIIWDNRLVCHRSGRMKEVQKPSAASPASDQTMMFRLTAFDSTPLSAPARASDPTSRRTVAAWREL